MPKFDVQLLGLGKESKRFRLPISRGESSRHQPPIGN